jgi:hypothetical protein
MREKISENHLRELSLLLLRASCPTVNLLIQHLTTQGTARWGGLGGHIITRCWYKCRLTHTCP